MSDEAIMKERYDSLDFSIALNHLKNGERIAREGWNGKNMFLIKAGDYAVEIDEMRDGSPISREFVKESGVSEFKIQPHIDMWTAQKTYLVGWLPSQIDLFATDWYVLPK